jgi:aspartate/methionine/tyrosine aminotransferase
VNLFALERFFAKHEFKVKHILSASDVEALSIHDLVGMADKDSMTLWNNLKFSYTEPTGHPLLRAEISSLYHQIDPNDLLVAAPEELIYIAFQSLLSKDDHIIVTTPAYQSLHEIASHIGCRVDRWDLRRSEDGWMLDLEFLRDHVTDKTTLIVINFPHNPTGHHISVDVQRQIVEIARRHNVWIFSDEMYRGTEYRIEDQLPSIVDEYERGISLWGLSKSFALPGLRIGWLASQSAEFLAKCSAMRDYLTICSSAPSEVLALMALRSRDPILTRSRKIITENLVFADSFFAEHSGTFDWLRPKAGSVAFPSLKKNISIETFCDELISRRGILVAPGLLFQYSGNHFRIGLGRKSFRDVLPLLAS